MAFSPDDVAAVIAPRHDTVSEPGCRWTRVLLAVAAVLALLVLILSLSWPLGPDHVVIGQVARSWLNSGVLFREAVDIKGPWTYVPFLALAPGSADAVLLRALDLVVISAALWSICRVVAQFRGPSTSVWFAVFAVAVLFRPGYEQTAQPDVWIALAVCAVTVHLVFRGGDRSEVTLFSLGLIAGIGVLVKPFYLVLVALPWAMRQLGVPVSITRRGFALGALGFAITAGGMLAWLAATGSLRDVLAVYSGPLLRAYAMQGKSLPAMQHAERFGTGLLRTYVAPLVVLAGAGVWTLVMERRVAIARGLALLLAGGVGVLVLQGRYFPYHWAAVTLPLALFAAVGTQALEGTTRRLSVSRVLAWAATLVLVASLGRSIVRDVHNTIAWRAVHPGESWVHALREHPRAGDQGPLMDDETAAAFLQTRVGRGESVGIWAFSARSVFLANRPPATRIFSINPALLSRTPIADSLLFDMAAGLRRAAPRYVLIDCGPGRRFPEWLPSRSPEFVRLMEDRYRVDRALGDLRLLRRADSSETAPGALPLRGDPCAIGESRGR